MQIISNYNLSIYPKTNNQKTKTNPNFGINPAKVASSLSLGIPAAGIVAARKLMKFDPDTVRDMNGNSASGKTVSGLTDLPADENGYTHLHYLCEYDNFKSVKKFLDLNPDINLSQMTKKGATCMYFAIYKQKKDVINLIARMDNYNPTVTNENGFTDFHRLCEYGYTDVVKTLLEKHPEFDINQKTKYGSTCMSLAIYHWNKGIINLIAGMDNYNPTIPDRNGRTDLHRLCENGCTDLVKTLLEKHPEFDINQKTKDGDTCISLAIDNKHKDIVNLIAGMDNYNPTIPDRNGRTDLHRLCENGYTDAVKTLLEKHPEFDINQKTENGNTCMSLAIKNKHKDIVNLIAGMDNYNPTIADEDGWTDLHCLCDEGYADAVKTILEKHPDFDINQQTKNGMTCMYLAMFNDNEDIVNLIANMDNYKPDRSWLDLFGLCGRGYTDAVKALVEKHPESDLKVGLSHYYCVADPDLQKFIADIIDNDPDLKKFISDRMGKEPEKTISVRMDKEPEKTVSWTETLKEKCTQFFGNLFG